ncbi:MAG TPA: crossover junction endodeoxyribonuclease RuvC [Pyrinomonadaceae bacterium]|nr:crossover junction endodeoxyribonuclease RuvC [Pyrinomonadaceae bacterium]
MLSKASRLLANDHHEVEKILKKIEIALEAGNVESLYVGLDLFWARLAVHIRAEHLHLFPIVLTASQESETLDEQLPGADKAQTTIAKLRDDHDFFMHELANAVTQMREIRGVCELQAVRATLKVVARTVGQVKQRLTEHNKAEEMQVYRWLTPMLDPVELAKLASEISAELSKRPPRFTENVWTEID